MKTCEATNPTLSLSAYPEAGVYDGPHMITLLCVAEGAEIHYTRDGSEPTPASPVFDANRIIPLEQFGEDVPDGKRSYTIRAIAVAGDQVGDEAVFQYDIEPRDETTFISQQLFPGVRLIQDWINDKMYLVTGSERALLIDAGKSTGDLRSYIEPFVGDLPLDVCITHGHPDHIAAMGQFLADHAVYMHRADLPTLRMFKERMDYEIDEDRIQYIDEGFAFDLGDRRLTVYHVPGHTPGCLALLDEPSGILFASDAIGSNGPTIVDAVWLQRSTEGVDKFLSALQVFHAKVAGKVKYICTGHGVPYLEGEGYLDNLEEAAQQVVDHGVDVLVPSPRPGNTWRTVSGDRLTDPNWASINVNRDVPLSVPPEQMSSLSNLRIEGAAMAEGFTPDRLSYTATVSPDVQTVEIVPTATSRRYHSLTIDGAKVTSGQAFEAAVPDEGHTFTIEVVAPNETTKTTYALSVTRL